MKFLWVISVEPHGLPYTSTHSLGKAMDQCSDSNLRQVPLEVLCADARTQEARFALGEAADDGPGLELFRRAIAECDEQAWVAVIELYRSVLEGQVGRVLVMHRLADEDYRFWINRAFQRFWGATRGRHMSHFATLASVLKYLKMCLASVVLDDACAKRRYACLSIDEVPAKVRVSTDPAGVAIDHIARHELWHTVERELPEANERLVAHLTFVAGLSPREILARHPDEFEDIIDVYRTKRSLIQRLRRSHALRHLLGRSPASRRAASQQDQSVGQFCATSWIRSPEDQQHLAPT